MAWEWPAETRRCILTRIKISVAPTARESGFKGREAPISFSLGALDHTINDQSTLKAVNLARVYVHVHPRVCVHVHPRVYVHVHTYQSAKISTRYNYH